MVALRGALNIDMRGGAKFSRKKVREKFKKWAEPRPFFITPRDLHEANSPLLFFLDGNAQYRIDCYLSLMPLVRSFPHCTQGNTFLGIYYYYCYLSLMPLVRSLPHCAQGNTFLGIISPREFMPCLRALTNTGNKYFLRAYFT